MSTSAFGEFLSVEGTFGCIASHPTLPLIACASTMLRRSSGDDVLQIYSTLASQQQPTNANAITSNNPPSPSLKQPSQQQQQQQNQNVMNTVFMNRTTVNVMKWHPTLQVLAIGCQNGTVLIVLCNCTT